MRIKSLPVHSFQITLALGFLMGVILLWLVGLQTHIPGEYVPQHTIYATKVKPPEKSNTQTGPSISGHANPPIYSPSTEVSSTSNATTYTTTSPWYTVVNFYGEQLSTNDWTIATESTENNTTTINAKGNGETIGVAITNSGNNQTTFTVQL